MVGKHHVEIGNKRVRYILDIERKITVIKGNSGTGKTTLIRMLQGYNAQGNKSGISVKNDTNIPLIVYTSLTKWEKDLKETKESIIFVDEVVDYLYSKSFQQEIVKSDNYLVVISRSGKFNHLPYALQSVYALYTDMHDKIKITKMYQLYHFNEKNMIPATIITEDSNAGAEMMSCIFNKKVISAYGNSNISKELLNHLDDKSVFVIVDGAAFGGFISQVMNLSKLNDDIYIYAPESFEYMILQTHSFRRQLNDELENTWKYSDISQYLTWEQYYTELLKNICREVYGFVYDKSRLHQSLLNKDTIQQVQNYLYYSLVKETSSD
ncbi:MAG: ABC transporter ATP-binding protein [Erysipelotrichaceae bacterium]|nr:ABC transporter ATP-binding protein [Erysipelotrichaceae bacterium]